MQYTYAVSSPVNKIIKPADLNLNLRAVRQNLKAEALDLKKKNKVSSNRSWGSDSSRIITEEKEESFGKRKHKLKKSSKNISVASRSKDKSIQSTRRGSLWRKVVSQIPADYENKSAFFYKRANLENPKKNPKMLAQKSDINEANKSKIGSDPEITLPLVGSLRSPEFSNFKVLVKEVPLILKKDKRNVELEDDMSMSVQKAEFLSGFPYNMPSPYTNSPPHISMNDFKKSVENRSSNMAEDPRASMDMEFRSESFYGQESPPTANRNIRRLNNKQINSPELFLKSRLGKQNNLPILTASKAEATSIVKESLNTKEDTSRFFLIRRSNNQAFKPSEHLDWIDTEADPMVIINKVYRHKLKKLKALEKKFQINYTAGGDRKAEPAAFKRDIRLEFNLSNDQTDSPFFFDRNSSIRKTKKKKLVISPQKKLFNSSQNIRTEEQERFLQVWGTNRCGGLFKKMPFVDQTQLFYDDAKKIEDGGPLFFKAFRTYKQSND